MRKLFFLAVFFILLLWKPCAASADGPASSTLVFSQSATLSIGGANGYQCFDNGVGFQRQCDFTVSFAIGDAPVSADYIAIDHGTPVQGYAYWGLIFGANVQGLYEGQSQLLDDLERNDGNGSSSQVIWAKLLRNGPFTFKANTTYRFVYDFYYDRTQPNPFPSGSQVSVELYALHPPVREPVVIVPGIVGSRLVRASDGAEVWPDADAMIFSGADTYLNPLGLSPSGNELAGDEMIPADILRAVTTSIPFVMEDVYGPLISSFLKDGYIEGRDLFVAPYDWRADIESSARSIGAVIEKAVSASADGKINIVAHSMGGLVVKEYLSQATSTVFLNKLIFIGVPQLGAPLAFKVLDYGDDLGFHIGPFSFLNAGEIKTIAQNMPGLYELLPSRRYVAVAGGYLFDERNGRSVALGFEGTTVPNAALFAAADTFHAAFDAAPVAPGPDVYNIVGCGNAATVSGIVLEDGGFVRVRHGNGDGTVPAVSAMDHAAGYHDYFSLAEENGADHQGLAKDGKLLSLIDAIVADATSTLALGPLGISTDLGDCAQGRFGSGSALAMITVSISGPADLGVYDSEGNHTGPNASGSVDLQIPWSSFTTIGSNEFITLPASGMYRSIVTPKTSNGASDHGEIIEIVEQYSSTADVLKETTYEHINLPGASSTASLAIPTSTSVSTSTPDPPVILDSDGDGVFGGAIPPTAELASSSAADIAPPIITMPSLGTSTPAGATTTITFSAADDGSGVATTTATLDGDAVGSGASVANLPPGDHVLEVTALDNAGNIRIQSTTITIVSPPAPPRKCQHR